MNGTRAYVSELLIPATTLWQRDVVRFYRQPSRVVGALASPLVFWLLIGSGLGRSFRPGGASGSHYLEYFFPGTMLLIVLFTAIFSTISVIEDRREGFLQGVLVAPVSRGAIALGKILGGATLATLQGLVFMLFEPLIGIGMTPWSGLGMVPVLLLVSFGITGLGMLIAWPMESTQGFHAVMNLFLVPLWLLSGALFPASGASFWVRGLMRINPLTYNLALIRRVMYGDEADLSAMGHIPSLQLSLAISILFAVMVFGGATILVCRQNRTRI